MRSRLQTVAVARARGRMRAVCREYLRCATTAAVLVRKDEIAAVGAVPVAVTSAAGLRTSRLFAAALWWWCTAARNPRCWRLCHRRWQPARSSSRAGRLELATAASILPREDEIVALRADPVARTRARHPWQRRARQRLGLATAASILVPEHNVVALRAVPVALASRRAAGGDGHVRQRSMMPHVA